MAGKQAITHPMRKLLSSRRGILASAAAAVAALHGLRPEVAHAAPISGDSATSEPAVKGTTSYAGGTAVYGRASSGTGLGYGVQGDSSSSSDDATGVVGIAAATTGRVYGVAGFSNSSAGCGVFGQSNGTASSVGVRGESITEGYGVYGKTTNGIAVRGEATGGGYGVEGIGTSNYGVYGHATNGTGVLGESTNAVGIRGRSTNSHGCGGTTSKSGQAGLFGITGTTGAVAMLGIHTGAGGVAGYFTGNVYISGTLTVASGAKSAAVKKKDGSMARVYCQESPEPWFEDFGTAEAVETNNAAHVGCLFVGTGLLITIVMICIR